MSLVASLVLFVAVIALACAVEDSAGDRLYLLFALPALLFGLLTGSWWTVAIPVGLATAAFAVGVECSASEAPQALLLAGAAVGVLARATADGLTGHR